MKSLLKEFVNQADLKKVDGSDAGKTDVVDKAGTKDVQFSLMRNTINSDGKINGANVNDYLEKAKDLNDEVDSVLYGLETDDGEVVKVYVNATQADAFEAEMKKMLGMEDDIEQVVNDLATRFDIIDVVWPKSSQVSNPDGTPAEAPADEPLDMGADAPADGEGEEEGDDDMEVIASADDIADDESTPDDKKVVKAEKSKKPVKAGAEDEAPAEEEGEGSEEEATEKKPKKPAAKEGNKHDKLKGLGKGLKGEKKTEVTEEGLEEAALQPGWYVMDEDDKTVAGPMSEEAARKLCSQKGGDAKGFSVTCVSDHAARKSNEEVNMTIGKKFLDRYLGEAVQLDEAKKDVDGRRDNIDVPGLTRTSPLLSAQTQLAVLATQLYVAMGIPAETLQRKVRATREGADALGEKMRLNPTLRRVVTNFFNALAAQHGWVRAEVKEAKEVMPQDDFTLMGSRALAQLEAALVALECPEAVVKMAIRQNRESLTDTALLLQKGALRTRFQRMASEIGLELQAVTSGKKASELEPEEVTEAADRSRYGWYNKKKSSDEDEDDDEFMMDKKTGKLVSVPKKKPDDKKKVEEAIDPAGADLYADAVMSLVAALGVPDAAFSRTARTVIAKEFRNMRTDVNVGGLLSLIKRFTAQFDAAKSRMTRQKPAGTQGTQGTV